jgi:hypothetical protein
MTLLSSMAGLDPAIQGDKRQCLRPLDGRLRAAHGEVLP